MIFRRGLIIGTSEDTAIPDLMTDTIYPGEIRIKINNAIRPHIETISFLTTKPTGKINVNAKRIKTTPKCFKSPKGYLNEVDIIFPKSILPHHYKLLFQISIFCDFTK